MVKIAAILVKKITRKVDVKQRLYHLIHPIVLSDTTSVVSDCMHDYWLNFKFFWGFFFMNYLSFMTTTNKIPGFHLGRCLYIPVHPPGFTLWVLHKVSLGRLVRIVLFPTGRNVHQLRKTKDYHCWPTETSGLWPTSDTTDDKLNDFEHKWAAQKLSDVF